MQAMVILRRCRDAEREIRRIQLRIRQREELAGSIGAPALDPNRVGRGSGDPDKNGRLAVEIADLKDELTARRERMAVEIASAQALLDLVPETESEVLHCYYLRYMSTGEVARKLNYQEGYVRKVKRRGEEIMALLSAEQVAKTLPKWYLEAETNGGRRRE